MSYGIFFFKFELIFFLIYNIHNYSYFVIKNNFVLNSNKFIKYIKIYKNNIYYYIFFILCNYICLVDIIILFDYFYYL